MKILIIASPRCGGYTLHKELAKTYDLTAIHEPKWEGLGKEFIEDSCVKVIVYENSFEELVSLAKKFDYIILLDRKDKVAQTQAIVSLNANGGNMRVKWEWEEGIQRERNHGIHLRNDIRDLDGHQSPILLTLYHLF